MLVKKIVCGLNEPPRPRQIRSLRAIFLMARLPLLFQGGDFASQRFTLNSSTSGGLKLDSSQPEVQFEISDFGFEMQDSSNFKIL